MFKLSDLIKVKPKLRNEVRTYDYILPLSGAYATPAARTLGVSSVSLDRSQRQPALVTSEFKRERGRRADRALPAQGQRADGPRRSTRWRHGGAVGVPNMGGALIRNSRFALSTSYAATRRAGCSPVRRGETLRESRSSPRNGIEDLFLVHLQQPPVHAERGRQGTRRVFAVDAGGSVGL